MIGLFHEFVLPVLLAFLLWGIAFLFFYFFDSPRCRYCNQRMRLDYWGGFRRWNCDDCMSAVFERKR